MFSRACARYAVDINKVIHTNSGFLQNPRQIKHLPGEPKAEPHQKAPSYHNPGGRGTLDKATYAHFGACGGAAIYRRGPKAGLETVGPTSLIHKDFFDTLGTPELHCAAQLCTACPLDVPGCPQSYPQPGPKSLRAPGDRLRQTRAPPWPLPPSLPCPSPYPTPRPPHRHPPQPTVA